MLYGIKPRSKHCTHNSGASPGEPNFNLTVSPEKPIKLKLPVRCICPVKQDYDDTISNPSNGGEGGLSTNKTIMISIQLKT